VELAYKPQAALAASSRALPKGDTASVSARCSPNNLLINDNSHSAAVEVFLLDTTARCSQTRIAYQLKRLPNSQCFKSNTLSRGETIDNSLHPEEHDGLAIGLPHAE
jgi:hypothetical protein